VPLIPSYLNKLAQLWRSLKISEAHLHTAGVAGSKPAAPTRQCADFSEVFEVRHGVLRCRFFGLHRKFATRSQIHDAYRFRSLRVELEVASLRRDAVHRVA